MELIFGKNNLRRISLILLPGIIIALLIALLNKPENLTDLLSLVLVVDIVSGIISNSTKPTQEAWLKVRNIYKYLFLTIHLTLYPAILVVIVENDILQNILIFLLIVKISIFTYGQRKIITKASN